MIACITGVGIGGGLVYVTCAWITTNYANDHEKSKFGIVATNVGSIGALLGTLIALLAVRQRTNGSSLPSGVYQGFLVIQLVALVLVLFIKPPHKTFRSDGSAIETDNLAGFLRETTNCLQALKNPVFLMMIPAFLPARSFLVYNGSINGLHSLFEIYLLTCYFSSFSKQYQNALTIKFSCYCCSSPLWVPFVGLHHRQREIEAKDASHY